MKKIITSIFVLTLSVGGLAQNEQLVREVEYYIAKIDSLRNCCSFRCFAIIHGSGDNFSSYSYSIYSPVDMLDSILCHDNNAWNFEKYVDEGKVIRQEVHVRSVQHNGFSFPHTRYVSKTFYKMGKLVAIEEHTARFVAWSELDEETKKIMIEHGYDDKYDIRQNLVTVLYIKDGKVIYHKGLEKDVKSLMQKHNLQFSVRDN